MARANTSAWLARPGWRASERRGRLSLTDGTLVLQGRRPFALRRLHDVELVRRRGNPRVAFLFALLPLVGVGIAGALMPSPLRDYLWFSGPLVLIVGWLALWSAWRTQHALWVRVRGTSAVAEMEVEVLLEGMPAVSRQKTVALARALEAACTR